METIDRIKEETLRRMRWRLWFAFRDSGYKQFCYVRKDGKVEPLYEGIKEYCREHWGKEIGTMNERELSRYIAVVNRWNKNK